MNPRATTSTHWLLAVLCIAGACTAEDAEVEPVPYIVEDVETPMPIEGTDGLAETIRAAVDRALEVDPRPVFALYHEVTATRDAACPSWFGDDAYANWYGECSAEGGADFSGYGGHDVQYGEDSSVESVYVTGSIVTPEGDTFVGGGQAYLGHGVEADGSEVGYAGVVGTFLWDGLGFEDTWLAEGGEQSLQKYWVRADWGQAVVLEGAVEVDGQAVALQTVSVSEGCAIEPQGTVSIRTEDGWVDVLFDLTLDTPMDPRECDGCGTAYYRGDVVGVVCVDLFDVATFGEDPW